MKLEQEKIGMAIRIDRERLGMTQGELAKKLGVRQQSIAKYENGSIPRINKRKALISALGKDSETAKLLNQIDIVTPQAIKEMTNKEAYEQAIEMGRRAGELYKELKEISGLKLDAYEKELARLEAIVAKYKEKFGEL